MFLRTLTLLAVALMAFGGSASAVSVGAVRVFDAAPCAVAPAGTSYAKTFDLVLTPGARVVVASNAAGTTGVFNLNAYVSVRVDNPDGSSSVRNNLLYPLYTPCQGASWPPIDITDMFKFPASSSVTVSVNAHNCNCGPSSWYLQHSPIYIVGIGGASGASVVSLQG